jgi:hypothetical protein
MFVAGNKTTSKSLSEKFAKSVDNKIKDVLTYTSVDDDFSEEDLL